MAFTECMKSELDLFRPSSIQTNILKNEEVPYKPITSLENQSVIEFACYGHGDAYLDLSSINLRLKLQIYKADGSLYVAADNEQPGIVNNILHSLFHQVGISLNGKNINSTNGNYSYRAYIEQLLNYGDDAHKTHLQLAGWILDEKAVDSLTANEGLKARTNLTKNSKIIEVYGKIHADMLNQPLLLLNNVDLRIALTLNKPEFYLLAEDKDMSFVKITEATLYMRHVTVNPNILIAHHKMLETTTAKYHYKRNEIKTFTIPSGGTSISLDNIVIGQLPTNLIFMMIDNDAYTGKRSKNPFNFKHNKITSFALYMNGVQIPNDPIEMSFSDNSYCARAYSTIFAANGILHTSQGNLISKEMFNNGFFMLAFDLTADMSSNEACNSLMNQGNLRLEARFGAPLPSTITCLIYLEYDATLEIDKNRNIMTNY